MRLASLPRLEALEIDSSYLIAGVSFQKGFRPSPSLEKITLSLWGLALQEDHFAPLLSWASAGPLKEINLNVFPLPAFVPGILSRLPRVRALHLGGTDLLGAGVDALARLPSLQTLRFGHTGATEAVLERLAEVPSLRDLGTLQGITDASVRHLAKLPLLRRLRLYSCPGVTDASAEVLAGFARLEELKIESCGLSASAVESLRQALPCCRVEA